MANQLVWEMQYSASRRKHHHRCQGCHRIVRDGESVYMARVANRRTRVVHAACADTPAVPGESLTVLGLMEMHAQDYRSP